MEFNDVLGLGKVLPVSKLLDVIQLGVGRVSKHFFDRIDVRTEAYRIKILAQAKVDSYNLISKTIRENSSAEIVFQDSEVSIKGKDGALTHLEERINTRLEYQEAKRQLNIENVSRYAADELIDEEPVTDKSVDEDWIARFFTIVQDVGEQEMQELWGKILAGEVKQPKSFSMRTLEAVRNFTKEDALLFNRIANYAVTSDAETYFLFKYSMNDLTVGYTGIIEKDILFTDIKLLSEMGVLHDSVSLTRQFNHVANDVVIPFSIGNCLVLVSRKPNDKPVSIGVELFTKTGNELLRLVSGKPSFKYLNGFANAFVSAGSKVTYSDFISHKNGKFIGGQVLGELPVNKPAE